MVAKERKANRLKTGSLVGQYLNTYLDEIRRAPQEGKLVAYTCGFPIWFMLSAQDIAYVHGEGYGAFSSARKWERPFMEVSAAEGVSEELCSYSRTHFGCALMSQRDVPANFAAPESLLPEPQLAATVHSICSTELAWVRAFHQLNKIPTFVVEVPYIQDVKDEERHHKTMVARLRDFVSFIEDVSGRPYNWERLYELMTVIKKAATLRAEGLELGSRHVPAPGTFFDWGICLGPINYLAGRPETIGFYEQLKAEIEDRAAHNIGAVPDEKYRVLWEGIMFWPKVGPLSEKFAEANCAVIGGSYSHLSFWPFPDQIDLERPLETIATFVLGAGVVNRPPEVLHSRMVQMCKDYSIDGAILSVPHTCRPLSGTLQMVANRLQRELGIPVVEFQGDQCDLNFYSDLRTNYAIDALIEAMAAGKKRRPTAGG